MNLRRKGLAREIAIVLVLKVAAIAAIWALFFTPESRPKVGPGAIERHMFDAPGNSPMGPSAAETNR